tara:strand:- start:997 stop:1566 length:570 start_codon:yes stop_codon:yes gene_type:complete
MEEKIKQIIENSTNNIKKIVEISDKIEQSIEVIINCFQNGNKVIIFGNGGSAADAQHIASELVGKFNLERKSYPAIALTTDSSVLTSLSNDYSFDVVFKRQCESLVSKNDVVIGISTSGNSKNILEGLIEAKHRDATTIGLLGNKGGNIKNNVDIAIIVDSSHTPRIQEAHRTIYHIICEIVEKELSSK